MDNVTDFKSRNDALKVGKYENEATGAVRLSTGISSATRQINQLHSLVPFTDPEKGSVLSALVMARSSKRLAVLFTILGLFGAYHFLVDYSQSFRRQDTPNWADILELKVEDIDDTKDGIISTSPSYRPRKILVYWVDFNPESRPPKIGDYVYYYDVASAFNRHAQVEVCKESSLKECWDQAQNETSILVPIINHWLISKDKYKDKCRVLADKLTVLFQQAEQETPCVTVLFLLNKVYKDLDRKVGWLVGPFANLTNVRINTTATTALPDTSAPSATINIMATTWSPHAVEWSSQFGFPIVFCPFATNVSSFDLTAHRQASTPWSKRSCVVFLRWDTNPKKYRLREETHTELSGGKIHKDIEVIAPIKYISENAYKRRLVQCKMTVTTIGMPGWIDILGTRYYEVMASGTTLLLAERPSSSFSRDSYQQLGFIENETMVVFSSVPELLDKIRYYQRHPEEATAIIHRAHERAVLQYGWETRAQLMVEAVWQHSKC